MTTHREPTPPNPDPGAVYHLAAGDYTAEVGSRGAALRSLRWRGRDLVVPQTPELSLLAYSGRVLAPWPNRLRDGTYTWAREHYHVPINELATRTALHGLVCWTDFPTAQQPSPHELNLRTTIHDPGYPTDLELRVSYQLRPEGLTVSITATNAGTQSAPYGVSIHPYLTCDGLPADECTLTLPADRVLTVDDRLLPVRIGAVSGELDLRTPAELGSRQLDHAFTTLPERWHARLAGGGLAVVLESDARWAQVYSGEEIGRVGVAVEPMTCPPDAFNTGVDLIELEPGEQHLFTFTIHGE